MPHAYTRTHARTHTYARTHSQRTGGDKNNHVEASPRHAPFFLLCPVLEMLVLENRVVMLKFPWHRPVATESSKPTSVNIPGAGGRLKFDNLAQTAGCQNVKRSGGIDQQGRIERFCLSAECLERNYCSKSVRQVRSKAIVVISVIVDVCNSEQ